MCDTIIIVVTFLNPRKNEGKKKVERLMLWVVVGFKTVVQQNRLEPK